LLVGIDDYASPRVPDLGGCLNDVNAMELLLQDRFNVPPENIRKLTNSHATHQAVKAGFKDHLITQTTAWVNAGKPEPPPAFLFHYSGHGSQALDETSTEPDGLDETIVPHDSRVGDVYDIKDWELGQLIDELTASFSEENANVTIILDCCHSGSGTRDIKPTLIPSRRCQPDLRPQPTKRSDVTVAGTRSVVAPSGWMLGGKYVLLAGCRDREEANEYVASAGRELPSQQHGAMSYFMLQELNRMPAGRPLTYRDLHERVRYQVNSRYENQMPQCEGTKDREIFGGLKPLDDMLLTVVDKSGMIWVNGGAAHGLTEGSQLHVYPPNTTSLKTAGEPKTTLYVEEVGAVKSGCLIELGEPEVELHSRVAIAHIDYSQLQQRVVPDIADEALAKEVTGLLTTDQIKPYVSLIAAEQPADLRVQQIGADQLELQDSTGKPLVATFPPDKRPELPSDIQHIARYYNALKLTNPSGELAGTIAVSFKKLLLEAGQVKTADVSANAEDELELVTGERIVVEVTNTAGRPLYVAVFNFAHDWSVNQLYPRVEGEHTALEPGRTIALGLSAKRKEQLMPGLSEGINEAREFIKVIATVDETDFELLQMHPLKTAGATRSIAQAGKRSALTALLERAAQGSSTRALGTPPSTSQDEWTTTDVQFRLVRPLDDKEIARSLPGAVRTILPSYGLELEPPAGFQGQVRVLTARQNTRSATGELTDLEPPPAFAAFKQYFVAVNVPSKGTRNVDPGGAVIEIEADDQARAVVTEATPFKLHLPEGMTGEGEVMLALAYDGSFFYPVGRPGDEANTLNIEWLPEAMPEEEAPTRSTRRIGRTVKLYLFKMVGWSEPSLGLHKARFGPVAGLDEDQPEADERSYEVQGGQARYRPLKDGELQTGQRAMLFVHGFTSETKWMVGSILPWLEANGLHYDHYLTFDYETFNTRISQNGLNLANALRATGFGPGDGLQLDVYAHSMGTQVVRSMVEQHGGEEFVDRCFLTGPPNMGTRLAEAKRLVPWLGTLLLNQAGPTPPTVIASWALNKVADDAVGGDDLRPGSEFYQLLNGSTQPARVPYYILAGRNELPTEYKHVWDRLAKTLSGAADAGLDLLFGDQHDLVINEQSMLTVRNGNYPPELLKTQVLACNHFQYFSSAEGQATLLAWLKA
jgi:hypothetical protein